MRDLLVGRVPREIVRISKLLHEKGMLAAADGNISFRANDRIWITPSGVSKAFMRPSQMALMDSSGQVLRGAPSSERLMHLAVYKHCPQARAVVHAHPATAIAWTIADPECRELPSGCMSELILGVGRIPVVPFARPGTAAMGEVLKPYLPDCRVMVLARHGALAWGASLEEAYRGIERLEHTATILMRAKLLGGLTYLPEDELDYLRATRTALVSKNGGTIL